MTNPIKKDDYKLFEQENIVLHIYLKKTFFRGSFKFKDY